MPFTLKHVPDHLLLPILSKMSVMTLVGSQTVCKLIQDLSNLVDPRHNLIKNRLMLTFIEVSSIYLANKQSQDNFENIFSIDLNHQLQVDRRKVLAINQMEYCSFLCIRSVEIGPFSIYGPLSEHVYDKISSTLEELFGENVANCSNLFFNSRSPFRYQKAFLKYFRPEKAHLFQPEDISLGDYLQTKEIQKMRNIEVTATKMNHFKYSDIKNYSECSLSKVDYRNDLKDILIGMSMGRADKLKKLRIHARHPMEFQPTRYDLLEIGAEFVYRLKNSYLNHSQLTSDLYVLQSGRTFISIVFDNFSTSHSIYIKKLNKKEDFYINMISWLNESFQVKKIIDESVFYSKFMETQNEDLIEIAHEIVTFYHEK